MRNATGLLIGLLVLIASFSVSHAEFIAEGTVIKDTITGLEWLHMSKTKEISVAQILDTSKDPGAQLYSEGWRLATISEIKQLFDNADIPLGYMSPTALSAVQSFINLFGQTDTNTTWANSSAVAPKFDCCTDPTRYAPIVWISGGLAGSDFLGFGSIYSNYYGNWLVRKSADSKPMIIAYHFGGILQPSPQDSLYSGIQMNTPFHGIIRYSSDQTDLWQQDPTMGLYKFDTFSLSVGSQTIIADSSASYPNQTLQINNGTQGQTGPFYVTDTLLISSSKAIGAIGNINSVISFGLNLDSGQTNFFLDKSLPGDYLKLTDFPFSNLYLSGNQDQAPDGFVSMGGLLQYFEVLNNSPPRVGATGGGTYQIHELITLSGDVADDDGDKISYEWVDGDLVYFRSTNPITTNSNGSSVPIPSMTITFNSIGTRDLRLKVWDGVNEPVLSTSIIINIIDTEAPTLAPIPDKTILWPPNKKMKDIKILANALDNSGGPVTLSAAVSCNEAQEGDGDWTQPVINQETGTITLQLRADRFGKTDGRIYTITITGTDQFRNTSSANVKIIVPHDQGKK